MLERVLRHINNRFERAYVSGQFTVEDGAIDIEIPEGQYFWVEGSVWNDGLHEQGTRDMAEESWTGTVWLLAIPGAVLDLADEISDWCDRNADEIDTPYQSESFGGYTYTKGSGESSPSTWEGHFASRLNGFRKVSRSWT